MARYVSAIPVVTRRGLVKPYGRRPRPAGRLVDGRDALAARDDRITLDCAHYVILYVTFLTLKYVFRSRDRGIRVVGMIDFLKWYNLCTAHHSYVYIHSITL